MSRDIKWKVHLNSKPEEVYHYLTTKEGREKFWAESAPMVNGYIHFVFANGQEYRSKIVTSLPCSNFHIEYFDSMVEFTLQKDGSGGTDLIVLNSKIPEREYDDSLAGWVSLLLTLKAAIDFQVDLRNHDQEKTWDQGYVDN